MPIVEEKVRVERTEAPSRTVTATMGPEAETVSVSEAVTQDDVGVERVPVGKAIDSVVEDLLMRGRFQKLTERSVTLTQTEVTIWKD